MSSLGNNPTTFLHVVSGTINGGPGNITITEEEYHYDMSTFSSFIRNENKFEYDFKNSIGGVIKMFNISNDIEISALKHSYQESKTFREEINSRLSKRTYKGYLEKDEYYVTYAEMKLYLYKVRNESDGTIVKQYVVLPTGNFFAEVINSEKVIGLTLDESWSTLVGKLKAPVQCYKLNELITKISENRISQIEKIPIDVEKMPDVTSEGSCSKSTKIHGINITNDLDSEAITDIEIISVVSSKVASTFSYATDWTYVDVEKNQTDGRWYSRQIVKSDIRIECGGHGSIQCQLRFDEDYRHYWQFKCRIGGKAYKINKNNAMTNVWKQDENRSPRFTLLKEGQYFRINMAFNSGYSYFYLEEY